MNWLLNNRTFQMEEVAENETVRMGTTEVWEFVNETGGMGMMGGMNMAHPMHMHAVQFQVFDRQVAPDFREGWETLRQGFVDEGWKDTVLVRPGERVTRGGHIPGAANLFWMQNIMSREIPVMRPPAELRRLYEAAGATADRKVVTYCRTGGQASHAYFTAKYLGYDVVMYDGSFFEWSKTEGTAVVSGQRAK
jgi:rhodanese-related sulfurtransferase